MLQSSGRANEFQLSRIADRVASAAAKKPGQPLFNQPFWARFQSSRATMEGSNAVTPLWTGRYPASRFPANKINETVHQEFGRRVPEDRALPPVADEGTPAAASGKARLPLRKGRGSLLNFRRPGLAAERAAARVSSSRKSSSHPARFGSDRIEAFRRSGAARARFSAMSVNLVHPPRGPLPPQIVTGRATASVS